MSTPLVRLSGRRRPVSPQSTLTFASDDPSMPPLTDEGNIDRARCPRTDEQPCTHTACRHHLDVDDERAGQPHHGKHPEPRVRPRHEEQVDPTRGIRASCALDQVRDSNGNVVSEGVAIATSSVAKIMGVSQRRIQQLEQRGLDKLWVAKALEKVVEDWAESELYPHGATIDLEWGLEIVDGCGVQRQESKQLYVTMVVDLARFDRPVERGVRPIAPGVTARRK